MQVMMDEVGVFDGIDELNFAKTRLSGTEEALAAGVNKIMSAKGFTTYVGTLSSDVFSSLVTDSLSAIDELIELVTSKQEEIDAYNNASDWDKFWGTAGMISAKAVEGIFATGESIIDGGATLLGWGAGLVGANDFQNDVAAFIEKDHVGDFFYEQYETGFLQGINQNSIFKHDSTTASYIKVGGEIVGYIVVGLGATQLPFLSNLSAIASTAAVSGISGLGEGAEIHLQAGETFQSASAHGAGEALYQAGTAYLGGKVIDKVANSKFMNKLSTKVFKNGVSYADDGVKLLTNADDKLNLLTTVDDPVVNNIATSNSIIDKVGSKLTGVKNFAVGNLEKAKEIFKHPIKTIKDHINLKSTSDDFLEEGVKTLKTTQGSTIDKKAMDQLKQFSTVRDEYLVNRSLQSNGIINKVTSKLTSVKNFAVGNFEKVKEIVKHPIKTIKDHINLKNTGDEILDKSDDVLKSTNISNTTTTTTSQPQLKVSQTNQVLDTGTNVFKSGDEVITAIKDGKITATEGKKIITKLYGTQDGGVGHDFLAQISNYEKSLRKKSTQQLVSQLEPERLTPGSNQTLNNLKNVATTGLEKGKEILNNPVVGVTAGLAGGTWQIQQEEASKIYRQNNINNYAYELLGDDITEIRDSNPEVILDPEKTEEMQTAINTLKSNSQTEEHIQPPQQEQSETITSPGNSNNNQTTITPNIQGKVETTVNNIAPEEIPQAPSATQDQPSQPTVDIEGENPSITPPSDTNPTTPQPAPDNPGNIETPQQGESNTGEGNPGNINNDNIINNPGNTNNGNSNGNTNNPPISNTNNSGNTNTGYYVPNNTTNSTISNIKVPQDSPSPSMPENDLEIKDNSGETLDIISIDKPPTNTTTSSNDGGSAIPTILGVGAAGAAIAGGAYYIKKKSDRSKEQEYYEDEEEKQEQDNFAPHIPEEPIYQNEKYQAGTVNKLILDDTVDVKMNEDSDIIGPKNNEQE